MRSFIIILACVLPLRAQSLSYGTIARPGATIDFRNASTVLPDRHLAADPATCTLGEKYFNTTTAKGRRCTATNTWSDEAGASYTLPAATTSTLGGVRIGSGLAVDGSGILSASGSSLACDPFDITHFCMVEEWMTGGTSNGTAGSGGWKTSAVSSGTFTFVSMGSNSVTQHPGVFSITSTTSANSGGVITSGNAATNSSINLDDLLNRDWDVSWVFKLDSTSDVRVRLGLSADATNLAPATSAPTFTLRYDTDAGFSDNTKNTVGSWVAQFCGYSGSACGDTGGVTAALNIQPDTGWHQARIYKSGSTYYWQIDANAPKTMCASGCDMTTPSPTNPVVIGLAVHAAFGISGTTQRKIWLDRTTFKMTGLTRY